MTPAEAQQHALDELEKLGGKPVVLRPPEPVSVSRHRRGDRAIEGVCGCHTAAGGGRTARGHELLHTGPAVMQFWDYLTHLQWAKAQPELRRDVKSADAADFYAWYLGEISARTLSTTGRRLEEVDPFTPALLHLERDWSLDGRPYYNLWPSLLPALSRLKMDADASLFTLPLDRLLLRLPKAGNPLEWQHGGHTWVVRTVLCENTRLAHDTRPGAPALVIKEGEESPETVRGLTFWIDAGEDMTGKPVASEGPAVLRRMMYKHLVCVEGHSIEWSFEKIPAHPSTELGLAYPVEIVQAVARIVCTLCLMADDPQIVEPVVLKDDEQKYEKTLDPALVEKARRRGNRGWHVGKSIEVVPHVRAASPAALYWTGAGRKIPKIRFRRGTVVHRKKLTNVPTGFWADEES